MKFLRIIAILAIVTALSILTFYVDRERTYKASTLSGIFENQPTLAALDLQVAS